MATLEQCRVALADLAESLAGVDPDVRRRRIPPRSVSLHIRDLDQAFAGQLGPDGLTEVKPVPVPDAGAAQLRFEADSDAVVDVGEHPGRFGRAWLQGRVKVHASVRDLWQLRSVVL